MQSSLLTKSQRRELRRLAGLAHERELSAAAQDLAFSFDAWRSGKIDVFKLNEAVHRYYNGISRELYKRYAMGDEDISVIDAISRGIIKEAEVAPEILSRFRGALDSIKRHNDSNESE